MNTRRRGRPRLEEAAGIDRAIREAAVAILLDHGEAATVNAIAEASGLSRKTLYARYSTKTALFTDAIRDLMERAQPVGFDTGGSAEQRLYQYIRAALDLVSTPKAKAIQAILSADPSYIAVLRSDLLTAMKTQFYEPLQALLNDLVESREIVAIDVDYTVQAINALVFAFSSGFQEDMAGRPSGLSLDGHARSLTDLITRGILPR
jgi:TetR/AcrR family transcriptional regulator, mexJK operon transcriptional repressor